MFKTRFLDLPPLATAAGTVRLPGSKSISNRVLLLAGLCAGTTVIHDLLDSDDTRVMLDALRALGCGVAMDEAVVRINGIGGALAAREADIFLGNSGTSVRSVTAALAVLATTQGGRFALHGVPRMHERPIGDLVDALRPLGCVIDYTGVDGFPPLQLGDGATHALNLDAPIRVRGDVSSQFLTGLLQAMCLVAGDRDIVIEVVGELISKPYIAITLNLLARFGVKVRNEQWARFTIPQSSRLSSPGAIPVEGDASSASYFVALGAIAADPAAPVRVEGMGSASIQGDLAFVGAAQAMGANVLLGDNWVEVSRGSWPLKAITLDCNHIPDAAMTLAVMALYAHGTTRLTNIASWRVKETDRIAAMATELRKLGATVAEGADFIEVTPPATWQPAAIHTYDDHRIAMCFSLAAFNPAGLPVRILDPQCVGKTFPDYFETLFGVVTARERGVPIITVDGPTASGKGTLASALAQRLGYHFLDSGAVYRATALAAMRSGTRADDEQRLAQLATNLDLHFPPGQILMGDQDVTETLRLEEVGALASKISAFPLVRAALRTLQLSFHRLPGLVADGRDMGTVIFPGADLKIFLTASAATRAERRYKQLISKGISANIDSLRAELEARDARDQTRAVSPLRPAADAMLLDNSALTVEASVDAVLNAWQQRRPFDAS
ncbi:bifunctional 3-phosphoshikimate 1-carboxyvinyltransferase/cytidylate kinase [Rhizobacter sp. Root404]|uniref:bifunctional 3-phosphoshikimate 1-carboxyvinyltransferase/cytidylate kinase n=1 Tax=Rhizobacter sp. Root404 TaxID=1736528 RepID=UPI0006FC1577|nr:bifunctional 3-phosphoshikimate 1-carboxyvinyltransferase/cytidylate kinase [Rhizobacter sp. Root404]KQW36065.1 cytidylate kinase [Rhizobacter sp. Root404]